MDTKTELRTYLSMPGHTQSGLAEATGITQSAISQMLRSNRVIYVIERRTGRVELEERKLLGRSAA